MALTLIRHTQVAGADGLCYGHHEVALADPPTPPFAVIAEQVGQQAPTPIVGVVSSPSRRALALAEWLAAHWRVPLETDARWRELHFGAWEGRRWADIDRRDSDAWCADIEHVSPPGGESRAMLRKRVAAALAALHPRCRGAHWLVVTHAGPIRVALAAPLTQAVPFGASYTLVATNTGWRLLG